MSSLKVEGKGKDRVCRMNGVVLCYTQVQTPGKGFKGKGKEYSTEVVIDKDLKKAFKKQYPKTQIREIETSEFKEAFKIDPPFPDQDEQYTIKIKCNALMTAAVPAHGVDKGDLVPYSWGSRPKVWESIAKGKVKDVTRKKLVGNGSIGDVTFNTISNPEYGEFPALTGILVTDLVEYTPTKSNPFGEVVEEDVEDYNEMEEDNQSTNTPEEDDDGPEEESGNDSPDNDDDDDSPFDDED